MGFILYCQEIGKKFDYDEDQGYFGKRNLEASLIQAQETLPDLEYVSRQHFKVFKNDSGQYLVMNLSKNGTCINGMEISGVAEIKYGDLIRLGRKDMLNAFAVYFLEREKSEQTIKDLGEKK